MNPIPYIERQTGKLAYEKIYAGRAISLLYSGSYLGNLLKSFFSKNSFTSSLMGFWYRLPWTKRLIIPFIQKYGVNQEEFLLSPKEFTSFNDFFIRKLKPESRPIDSADAIIPADARYWFYNRVDGNTDFLIKGERLNRESLLGSREMSYRFEGGSVVIARLCPSDYHRFHFPFNCVPGEAKLINGPLYSVNPVSIKQNIEHLIKNKRKITYLDSPLFGKTAYIEIGATNVGTIKETFTPYIHTSKGTEKGYFEFGGSALVILFEPDVIDFSSDLLDATRQGHEIRCLLGQKMGLSRLSKQM